MKFRYPAEAAVRVPQQGAYDPIGMDCILEAPCDLYHRIGVGIFVLFAGKGVPFDFDIKWRMRGVGISERYILEEDVSCFFNYIRDAVTRIVNDPGTPSSKKAQAVYISCRETMKRAFPIPGGVYSAGPRGHQPDRRSDRQG